MDIIEYEDDFQDQDHFNPFGRAAWAYMEKQFRECPECNAKIGTLCPDCMIELNRRIEQSNGYIWSERLQKDNPSMNDPGYGPWLARQLESELSVCGQEALYRGIPIEIALKQSIKIQWIQTELARIGYKPESTASSRSVSKTDHGPSGMGSASELAYTSLTELTRRQPPPPRQMVERLARKVNGALNYCRRLS
jgi:hypothetical protein